MYLTPITLYFFLLSLITLYLILMQYSKFFTLPIFGYTMYLKMNFYFTLLYIFCFIFCALFALLDWYCSVLADIFIHLGEQINKDFGNFSVNNDQVEIAKPPKTENIVISAPVEENQQYSLLQTFQQKCSNYLVGRVEIIHAASQPNPENLRVGLDLYRGVSEIHYQPGIDGPHTPESLNLPDFNDNNTGIKIPIYSCDRTLEGGREVTIICVNPVAVIETYDQVMVASNATPSLTNLEQVFAKKGLWLSNLHKTQCVICDPMHEAEIRKIFAYKDGYEAIPPSNRFDSIPGPN